MTRWAMVANLEACVGCQTCTAACRHANATAPAQQWRSVLDVEFGQYPDVERSFIPVGCQHCAEAPCMDVCPSTATRKRSDGIVTIGYDICIGCSYCFVACPYEARFKINKPTFSFGKTPTSDEAERYDPGRVNVATKCTFCVDKVDAGLAAGLTPGVDPDATPACANACIASALHFGDLDDPQSNVSRMVANSDTFQMHDELGTNPGFHYVWDKNLANPAKRGKPPHLQTVWDWRAAGNFIFGGAGTGLLAFATLAALAASSVDRLPVAAALIMVLMGLSCVWLEIGRPLRALNVFRHPQRSWMSREAITSIPLMGFGALTVLTGNMVLQLLAGIVALFYLFCQAMMFKASKGIPAWRETTVVPLTVTTGLAEGAGAFLLYAIIAGVFRPWMTLVLAVVVVLRFVAWYAYQGRLLSNCPIGTRDALRAFAPGFVWGGHTLPVALIAAALIGNSFATPLIATAALLCIASGWLFKYVLVTKAAFTQGLSAPIAHDAPQGNIDNVKAGWT